MAVRRQLSLERLASSSAAAQGYERMADDTSYSHNTNDINQHQAVSLEMPTTCIQIEPPTQGKPAPAQSQQQQQQPDKQQQQSGGSSFPKLEEIHVSTLPPTGPSLSLAV
eukprot:jgi/Chlat1/2730/Chrsp182S02897